MTDKPFDYEHDFTELDNPGFEDGMPWEYKYIDIRDVDPEITNMQHAAYQTIINPKPGMIENFDVRVLLVWSLGILFGLMFWIWFGKTIWRWLG